MNRQQVDGRDAESPPGRIATLFFGRRHPITRLADRNWKDILASLTPFFLLTGVAVYGVLTFSYQAFYGKLHIDPADVGLSYSVVLSRSAGFVLCVAIFTPVLLITASAIDRVLRRPSWPMFQTALSCGALVLIFILYVLVLPSFAANEVKKGNPVGSISFPFFVRIPLLATHADPARVHTAGKPGESPTLDQLANVELLYLGRANNTIVVYNAAARRALYIPDSSVILEIIDCPYDSIGRRPCKYGFLFH